MIYGNQVGCELEASSMMVNFHGPKGVMQGSGRKAFSFPALNPRIVRSTCQARCSHLSSHDTAILGAINHSLIKFEVYSIRKNLTCTKNFVFKKAYTYTCMYVRTINENMGYEFERVQRGYMGGFAGKNGREK